MLKRNINLLSEEYAALKYLMSLMQEETGQWPTLSKAVGRIIKTMAIQRGHTYGDTHSSTAEDN